jgi:dermatan/chondrotin sulfate uronyl 2-O-sulfotransferase UST
LDFTTKKDEKQDRIRGSISNTTSRGFKLFLQPEEANRILNNSNDSPILVYNRVNKCGSSTLKVLIRELSKRNKFHCLDSNCMKGELHHNARELSPGQQERLVANLTRLPRPSYYSEHFHNIDWPAHNLTVNLVNMIRDPIDRVVSHFYHVEKIFFAGRQSYLLDDCVLSGAARCRVGGSPTPWGYTGIEMALSFFCGQRPVCTDPGSREALARALRAVETEYSVVGVLEQLNTTLAVMEALLPRWFLGASSLYQDQPILRNRNSHPEPGPRARALLEDRLGMDIEFHQAVTQRLHWQWLRIREQVIPVST